MPLGGLSGLFLFSSSIILAMRKYSNRRLRSWNQLSVTMAGNMNIRGISLWNSSQWYRYLVVLSKHLKLFLTFYTIIVAVEALLITIVITNHVSVTNCGGCPLNCHNLIQFLCVVIVLWGGILQVKGMLHSCYEIIGFSYIWCELDVLRGIRNRVTYLLRPSQLPVNLCKSGNRWVSTT